MRGEAKGPPPRVGAGPSHSHRSCARSARTLRAALGSLPPSTLSIGVHLQRVLWEVPYCDQLVYGFRGHLVLGPGQPLDVFDALQSRRFVARIGAVCSSCRYGDSRSTNDSSHHLSEGCGNTLPPSLPCRLSALHPPLQNGRGKVARSARDGAQTLDPGRTSWRSDEHVAPGLSRRGLHFP